MVVDIIAEAVIGLAIEELRKAILHARTRAVKFKAILTQLEDTLKFITPKINKIYELKESIDFPTNDIQRLRQLSFEAGKLIKKCSEIRWWNYCKKYRYSKKLLQIDDSLRRMFGEELPVAIWMDTTCIMFQFRELLRRLESIFLEPIFLLDPRNIDSSASNKFSGSKFLRVFSRLKKVFKALPQWVFLSLSPFTRRIGWHGNH